LQLKNGLGLPLKAWPLIAGVRIIASQPVLQVSKSKQLEIFLLPLKVKAKLCPTSAG